MRADTFALWLVVARRLPYNVSFDLAPGQAMVIEGEFVEIGRCRRTLKTVFIYGVARKLPFCERALLPADCPFRLQRGFPASHVRRGNTTDLFPFVHVVSNLFDFPDFPHSPMRERRRHLENLDMPAFRARRAIEKSQL